MVTPQNYRFTICPLDEHGTSRNTIGTGVRHEEPNHHLSDDHLCDLDRDLRYSRAGFARRTQSDSEPEFREAPAKFVDDPNERFDPDCNCKELCGGSSTLDDWQIFKGGSGQNCNTDKDAVAWVESPNLSGIGATEGIRMIDLIGFLGRVPSGFGAVQQKVEQLQPMARYELFYL